MCERSSVSSLVARLAFVLAAGCGAPSATAPATPPVLTSADAIEANVGRLVTLEGVVTQTKIPTILGVEIDLDTPTMRGQRARARGLLKKTVVTPAEIAEEKARSGEVATRGAGTFYRLTLLGSDMTSRAVLVP